MYEIPGEREKAWVYACAHVGGVLKFDGLDHLNDSE